MNKLRVCVLGERGLVGQEYVKRLQNHPYFELSRDLDTSRVIFSALPDVVAREEEAKYAEQGYAIFSSASYHRLEPDIPLIIPEINSDHLNLIREQQKKRKWNRGFIVAKPNCTLQSYLLPLFPLHQKFQLKSVLVTTLQSTSGAGKNYVLEQNVIPHIHSEEEKSEVEPLKILGAWTGEGIQVATDISISTHCNRVPVPLGHLACISCSFKKKPLRQEVLEAWRQFPSLSLPSAPQRCLHYSEENDRPQPQLDVDLEGGMAIAIGRLRSCSVLDFRFTALSHNLVRGAAGGGLLTAELVFKQGYLEGCYG